MHICVSFPLKLKVVTPIFYSIYITYKCCWSTSTLQSLNLSCATQSGSYSVQPQNSVKYTKKILQLQLTGRNCELLPSLHPLGLVLKNQEVGSEHHHISFTSHPGNKLFKLLHSSWHYGSPIPRQPNTETACFPLPPSLSTAYIYSSLFQDGYCILLQIHNYWILPILNITANSMHIMLFH